MSYAITAYFTDKTIASTRIYAAQGDVDETIEYGSGEYDRDGFVGRSVFTATPAEGCVFTQWVYRIGSTSGEQQFSTDNPFTYSGDEDIYIRAVGKQANDSWKLNTEDLGEVSSLKYVNINLGEYEIYCYSLSFSESGTAHFYTENAEADVCGYFSTSGGWDSESGEPSKTLVYNDDGNGMPNFRISYEVEAGETYYVWVRCLSPDSSGTTVLNIEVPATASRPSDFSWTYEKVKGETFNLTADEWNNFTSRINAFRKYKGLDDHDFTWAYSGNDFMAYMYNEARIATQEIDGYGTYIPEVKSGWQISAHMMNVLVSELNSIP